MRLFETSYPLIGQRLEIGGKFSTQECGEIILQMFRLPPLPGVPQDQLPQSLEECHRGLRHINWHKVTYFQGTLTQNGGDCRVSFVFIPKCKNIISLLNLYIFPSLSSRGVVGNCALSGQI